MKVGRHLGSTAQHRQNRVAVRTIKNGLNQRRLLADVPLNGVRLLDIVGCHDYDDKVALLNGLPNGAPDVTALGILGAILIVNGLHFELSECLCDPVLPTLVFLRIP